MRTLTVIAAIALLGLAACSSTGPRVPEDQAVQFQQPGPPFPYNSFICP
jgi:outer membrane biogenesis lipoprotein LolB